MDSRDLKRFLAVYKMGSIGAAAESLYLSQPALSKCIRLLEEQLGTRLFERTPTGTIPTKFGDSLSLHAKVIEAELRNAEREISMLIGATKGEVSIGVTPSVAAAIMPRVVQKIHADRPGIHLKICEGLMENNIPALRLGELDMVIGGWTQGMHAKLITEPVIRDGVGVFCSKNHPLSGKKVNLRALSEYPWVMAPHTQFWLEMFERVFITHGLNPPLANITANSTLFIKELLLGNEFLTFLPTMLLTRDIKLGLVVPLETDQISVKIDVMVCYREREAQPSLFNVVLSSLKEVCDLST